MISESQQEQAALYALGLLDADEAAAFERTLATEPGLTALVRGLQEAAALLTLAVENPATRPPAHLKAQLLRQIGAEAAPASSSAPKLVSRPAPAADHPVPPGARFGWMPWALAALLLGCCCFLAVERGTLLGQLQGLRQLAAVPTPAPLEALSKVSFLELEPTPDGPIKPRAAVLWDPKQHRGILQITQLAPPESGKDYQLWAVEADRKDPVNAGVVHVNAEGHAYVAFEPEKIPGDNKVVALALSLERAGGSPTNQGPILFLGKL